jgi:hypothetical protein
MTMMMASHSVVASPTTTSAATSTGVPKMTNGLRVRSVSDSAPAGTARASAATPSIATSRPIARAESR